MTKNITNVGGCPERQYSNRAANDKATSGLESWYWMCH